MATGSHYETKHRSSLTERQEEILDLVVLGCTNGEIAERLRMTLDGAKWHVSEIITKLGVDTREEAVEAWRRQQGFGRRLGRVLRSLVAPIAVHKAVAAGVAGAAVLGVAGVATFFAIRSSGSNPRSGGASPSETVFTSTGAPVANPLFNTIRMIDARVGWGQSQSGPNFSIVRSDDGGRTWHDVSPVPLQQWTLGADFFLDSEHAWAGIVEPIAPGATGRVRIFWTEDGGRTWREGPVLGTPVATPPTPALGTSTAPQFLGWLDFADVQHGWFMQAQWNGSNTSVPVALFRTADSGLTWREVSVSSSNPSDTSLPTACAKTGLTFLDASHGFATGSCTGGLPFLFVTDDGGTTWRRQTLTDPSGTSTIITNCNCYIPPPSFPTKQNGFLLIAGSAQALYATHDAGKTWQPLAFPQASTPFVMIEFVDNQHGWIATRDQLFRTTDSGRTWESVFDAFAFPLNFISATEGWSLISSPSTTPALSHTTDGGQTWQPVVP